MTRTINPAYEQSFAQQNPVTTNFPAQNNKWAQHLNSSPQQMNNSSNATTSGNLLSTAELMNTFGKNTSLVSSADILPTAKTGFQSTFGNQPFPSFGKNPAGYLQRLAETVPDAAEDIVRDIPGFFTGGQKLVKGLGDALQLSAGSEGPLSTFQNATGVNPSANFNAVSKMIKPYSDPILNYNIPYATNEPQDPVNKFVQGVMGGSVPYLAGPDGLAASLATGTVGGAMQTEPKTAGQFKSNLEKIGTLNALFGGLTVGAKLGGKYLFNKSGQAVNQIQRDLSQNNADMATVSRNKNDLLQGLGKTAPTVNSSMADALAEQNQTGMSADYKNDMSTLMGGAGKDLGDMGAGYNSLLGIENNNYAQTHLYDDQEIPQQSLNGISRPQDFNNTNNWDIPKDLQAEEMMNMLPQDMQQHIKNTFGKKDKLPPLPEILQTSTISPELEAEIRKSYGLSSESTLPSGLKPADMINSFSDDDKTNALKILQQKGAMKLNAKKVITSQLPTDLQEVLQSPGSSFIKTKGTTFQNDNAIGSLKSYIKQMNEAISPTAETWKNRTLARVSSHLNNNVLHPILKDLDKQHGTNQSDLKKLADSFHSNVIAPFKATPDLKKFASNLLIDPHPERVKPILEKALEKVNNIKKQIGDDGKKTNLSSSIIPNDHMIRPMYDQVKSLMQYRGNEGLKQLSGNSILKMPKEEQIKAFESGIKSGDIPATSPIIKKYYKPLKDQMTLEDNLTKIMKEKHAMIKQKIIDDANQKNRILSDNKNNIKDALMKARGFQRKLNENPGAMRELLMNNVKKLQYAKNAAGAIRYPVQAELNKKHQG